MGRKGVVMGSPKVAVGYVRRSTGKQDNAIEVQAGAIAKWCAANGVELVAVFVDSVSRTTSVDERQGLCACYAALRALGAGLLVVQKRDRMSDGAVIADAFERTAKAQGALVHDTEGATQAEGVGGVIDRGMRDLMSQVEIAQIKARTRAALAVKSARGELTGNAPFGMRVGEDGITLVQDEREQATLARVRDLTTVGMGSSAIARVLTSEGIVGRTGRPLAQCAVWGLMRRTM